MSEQNFQTPRGRGGARKILIVSVLFLFCIALLSAMLLSAIIFQPQTIEPEKKIIISAGTSTVQIAHQLKEYGIIKNEWTFIALAKLVFPHRSIKAGEYTIHGSFNLFDAVSLFVQGMPRKELTIRIIEGWTVRDIVLYTALQGMRSSSDFTQETKNDYTGQFSFLPSQSKGTSLEGYLFPDTYRIYADSTAHDLIVKMIENFALHYSADMARDTKNSGRDIHGIVTMASILEREVQSEKDRRMVADLFYRRIQRGMPLQADSTVNYITGKNDPQVRGVDLDNDSLYNTYKYKGLPSGPISNPGLISLRAALYPLANDYWFFLTKPDGSVVYSKTFQEHVLNKLKYLKKSGRAGSGSAG